jgi:hypothetical protein
MPDLHLAPIPDGYALVRPDGSRLFEAHGWRARRICLREAVRRGVLVLRV